MSVLDLQESYDRLKNSVGFVRLGRHTMFVVGGDDRAAFLHNFCTADIKGLGHGEITEAFVLNQKGKLLGHLHIIAGEHCLIVHTVPDQYEKLFEHFDKYVIRDDVNFTDQSDAYTHLFVLGPESDKKLEEMLGQSLPENQSVVGSFGGVLERIAHIDLAGLGWLISEARENQETVANALIEAGIEECDPAALEVMRIENAVPLFGTDANNENLPQELQHDEKAISFEKGCYLGQETVARIDSLGHVNRLFVAFESDEAIVPGFNLEQDGKSIGAVTSAVQIPGQQQWVGLGFIRREAATSGESFSVNGVPVRLRQPVES